jgi:hypothetical protein
MPRSEIRVKKATKEGTCYTEGRKAWEEIEEKELCKEEAWLSHSPHKVETF